MTMEDDGGCLIKKSHVMGMETEWTTQYRAKALSEWHRIIT